MSTLTDTDTLLTICAAIENICLNAQMIVSSHVHVRGQPDVLGQKRQMLYGPLGREAARLMGLMIGNAKLRQTYAALLDQLDRLASHDEEMVNWLAATTKTAEALKTQGRTTFPSSVLRPSSSLRHFL